MTRPIQALAPLPQNFPGSYSSRIPGRSKSGFRQPIVPAARGGESIGPGAGFETVCVA